MVSFYYYHVYRNSEIPVFNLNCVNLNQRPQKAASDLGLHCLPMSLLWDTRYKWVMVYQVLQRFLESSLNPVLK